MHKKGLITLVAIVVIAVAGVFVLGYSSKGSTDGNGNCTSTGKNYLVVIKDNKTNPENTTGSYCDTLTIRNEDNVTREIGFGPHDHHVPYDGVSSRILTKNESFTVTMSERGTFHFHDHFHDETEGYFTVK